MARASRNDSWQNLATGLGDALRDKRKSAIPIQDLLDQRTAEVLWRSDDMAARAVESPPEDALRRGFGFVIEANEDEDEDETDSDVTLKSLDGRSQDVVLSDDIVPPVAEQRQIGAGTRADAAQVTDPTLAVGEQDENNDAVALQKKVNKRLKQLGVKQAVLKALQFERAYGGAAIFLGTVDSSAGRAPFVIGRPLDLNATKELRFLTVLTPLELQPFRYYSDPLAPKYGEVQIWTLNPRSKGVGTRGQGMRVHESRLIILKGLRTSRFMAEMHNGFGDSVLNRMVEHIRNFSTGYDAAAVLISDFAQAVFKMKGLVETLQADEQGLVQRRATAMNFMRSTVGAMVIDSDEEFSRQQTPVTGLPDLLDRLANRLAAAMRMPVTKLMGQSPAGLNATGQADRDWYNDEVSTIQEQKAGPAIERIVEVELNATEGVTGGVVPNGWAIEFPPLEEPSEAETSKNRLQDAQADALWLDRGVIHPEEVAQSRFTGDKYGTEIKLNPDIRDAALDVQNEKAANDDVMRQAQLEGMQNPAPQLPPGGGKSKPGKKPFGK